MTSGYVELHSASAFSFLQGASQPEKLVERAVEIGMPAVALLDHNGVYGSARFYTAAKRNNIRAHIGAEIGVPSLGTRLTPPIWLPHQHIAEPARLPLLCESRQGYQNLCQLITRFKLRERTKGDGSAKLEEIQDYSRGLVCLTGGDEGPLAGALARGGEEAGFSREILEQLSGRVSHFEWRGPTDTMAHSFKRAGLDIKHRLVAKWLELSMRIQDYPRHLGQHSGGMIISQGQLDRVVPLERASMPDRTVVQWDKEDCADLGIVKVDLLGLGMMAVLKDCVELIPEHYGDPVDLANLREDADVYRTLQRADTVGMFRVESRAQMASLPRNKPEKFYDVVVQVAIIRPGPIVGKMMHPYMRRRQKKEEVTYPHPSLEGALKRTLGVPLFQEQLLRMAMTVANFTGAEAEELRRAVGMRRSWERMKNLEGKLRAGMTANGIDTVTQENIIQNISSFALYGFPESHAASFALIAYASAYLKVKYLAAFTCAILNNQPMGFYSPAVLIEDARRHGLRVKPIDIQVSEWAAHWSVSRTIHSRSDWVWATPRDFAAMLLKRSLVSAKTGDSAL
jgi:DNA polymerase III alpha subunit